MIELNPIDNDFDIEKHMDEPIRSALEATLTYYKTIGVNPPWISYLAKVENEYVGICSFKGKPINDTVEVAYFTFPPHENKGIASAMCKGLICIANKENMQVSITARTLPEQNASTRVLSKNGFILEKTVIDPEDGEVFQWVLPK